MLISAYHVFDFCFSVRFVNVYFTFASMLIDFFCLCWPVGVGPAHFIAVGVSRRCWLFSFGLLWVESVLASVLREGSIFACLFGSIVESLGVWGVYLILL